MDVAQYKLPRNESELFETKYGEGESIAPQLILGAWIIPVFPAIFIGARFYTTRCILRTKPKEDWFILVALIFSVLFSSSVTLQTQYGLGRHWGDVPRPKETYKYYLLRFQPLTSS
ncbi:hypothetical protein B0T20DRAFT_108536 [Sordaria brevicollis]|uniref:Rhodopsin domain-containing protein n=1 Tax=Sordaria brevicollis TaxID=83679 RepID=A0AAE0NV89_SORBR|nr:hypothetical protein B0T20DRAFT_108536 [Sordaria brevicollis]